MAAQNQHYVPRFMLKQFLSDQKKELVSVYDKQSDVSFRASLKNVMSERKFHDFRFDDYEVSFEDAMGKIESNIVPFYQKVISSEVLDFSPDELSAVSFLIAFQFLRSKTSRYRYAQMEEGIRSKVEAMGRSMDDVEGWEPLNEDRLKMLHLGFMKENIGYFAKTILNKDFFITKAKQGRSFYVSDNPVVLHNDNDFGPYGNLGFSVTGIQIYMPITSKLAICAFCPSISENLKKEADHHNDYVKREALSLALKYPEKQTEAKRFISDNVINFDDIPLIKAIKTGKPMEATDQNMDFYNYLQTAFSSRFIVCPDANFAVAKDVLRKSPHLRQGVTMKFN